MAAGPVGVKHPSKKFFTLSAGLSALAFLFSMIAIFVPWGHKDTGVFMRTSVDLWRNCDEFTNAPVFTYTCRTNDIDQVGSVAGGSKKCRGFFVATQFFTVAAVVCSFLALVTAALVIGKLWAKPTGLALVACVFAFLSFSMIMIAFLMWIVYTETNCQPGNPLFPLKSYSWGWILMVCATIWSLLAMLLAYLGLYSVLSYKPFIPQQAPSHFEMGAPIYEDIMPVPSPFGYPVVESPPYCGNMPSAVPYPATGYGQSPLPMF